MANAILNSRSHAQFDVLRYPGRCWIVRRLSSSPLPYCRIQTERAKTRTTTTNFVIIFLRVRSRGSAHAKNMLQAKKKSILRRCKKQDQTKATRNSGAIVHPTENKPAALTPHGL